jgi:hypothetical protein
LGARQLLEYLQHVHDEVGAVAGVGQAVVRHAIRRHHLLRIGEEIVHRLRRPGDAAALERRRAAKIMTLARPSSEDAAETGPTSLAARSGVAVLEDFLAAFGIALCMRHVGCQYKTHRHDRDRVEAHHHADTNGPGFLM